MTQQGRPVKLSGHEYTDAHGVRQVEHVEDPPDGSIPGAGQPRGRRRARHRLVTRPDALSTAADSASVVVSVAAAEVMAGWRALATLVARRRDDRGSTATPSDAWPWK